MGKNEIKIPKGSLRDLYEKQNLSISKLADIYDCGETTIQRKLHKYNIRVRPSINFLLTKEDKIESWILSSDELFFAFLAGYMDAEGDIGVYSKNVASLRIGTYDKNILSQIQNKLVNKGITSTLILDRPKGSKVNLPKEDRYTNKKYKTKHDFWRLAVYKKKALLKLFNLIVPYLRHPRMKSGLLKATKNIYWRNREFGNLRMG